MTVDRDSVLVGRELAEIPLPGGAVVTIIHRAGAVVIPRGPVVLEVDDQLTILAEPTAEAAVRRLLSEVVQTSEIPGSD
jgi:Trk K+ transport system NAD-binding subunit